jgi:thermitase
MPDSCLQGRTPRADDQRVRVALMLSFLVLAVLAPAAQAAPGATRIVVGRDPGLSNGDRAEIRQDAGVKLVRTLRVPNTEVVTTTDPKAALAALRADPNVRYAQIDHVRHAFTNDTDYDTQWALENTGTNLSSNFVYTTAPFGPLPNGTPDADMDVPDAWALGVLGAGTRVAVVDSGVDVTHPDLAGQVDTTLSRGFVNGIDAGYVDDNGHGTHVSGIVGALSGNSQGVSGIAPAGKLVELKALDPSGNGSDSDIAAAFAYAGQHGIPVVNASLGGPGASQVLTDSMAGYPNTLYVIAAGNDGVDNDTTDVWPCNAPAANVICVGASTQNDTVASFSDYGRETVDLFAPGEYIYSTWLGAGYQLDSGTSMASPAVAAEAALVHTAAPSLTATQVKATILAGAEVKAAFAGKSVSERRANAKDAVAMAQAHTVPVDADHDGVPDNLDNRIDTDGDGVLDASDQCPTTAAHTANGCPAPVVVTPAPTAATAVDTDGDGRADPVDLCPGEAAATTTGCPLPALRSITVRVAKVKRRANVKVRTTRAATVAVTVERRVCDKHGRKCRWRAAFSGRRASQANSASFETRKLARGRYRVAVRLSAPEGKTKLVRKPFKV